MPNNQYRVIIETAYALQRRAIKRGYRGIAEELRRQVATLSELVDRDGESSESACDRAECLRIVVHNAADVLYPF